jgi:hypothetical protein
MSANLPPILSPNFISPNQTVNPLEMPETTKALGSLNSTQKVRSFHSNAQNNVNQTALPILSPSLSSSSSSSLSSQALTSQRVDLSDSQKKAIQNKVIELFAQDRQRLVEEKAMSDEVLKYQQFEKTYDCLTSGSIAFTENYGSNSKENFFGTLYDVPMDQFHSITIGNNSIQGIGTSGLATCVAIIMIGKKRENEDDVLSLGHYSGIIPAQLALATMYEDLIKKGCSQKSIKTYLVGGELPDSERIGSLMHFNSLIKACLENPEYNYNLSAVRPNLNISDSDLSTRVVVTPNGIYYSLNKIFTSELPETNSMPLDGGEVEVEDEVEDEVEEKSVSCSK